MPMWFAVSLLFRNRRIEPEVRDLEGIEVTKELLSAVQEFLSMPFQQRPHFRGWAWEGERLLQNFCRYAIAKGAGEKGDCRYEHLLGFLEHRHLHGIPKEQLKGEAKVLAEFLRFLWERAGKSEDPLKGEDLDEDLGWLDDWYEESIILVQADDEKVARQKAEVMGERITTEYQREANPDTRWEFMGVLKVYEVLDETLQDGTEVFARFLTAKEARQLMRVYKRR